VNEQRQGRTEPGTDEDEEQASRQCVSAAEPKSGGARDHAWNHQNRIVEGNVGAENQRPGDGSGPGKLWAVFIAPPSGYQERQRDRGAEEGQQSAETVSGQQREESNEIDVLGKLAEALQAPERYYQARICHPDVPAKRDGGGAH